MKGMVFGALLMLLGVSGMWEFYRLSVIHPWTYNGISGLRGLLLGTGATWAYGALAVMSVAGFVTCFYEAYLSKKA